MKVETVIAANRLGLGARPRELARIDGKHLRWLKDQLAGPSRVPQVIQSLPTTPAILRELQGLRAQRRQARKSNDASPEIKKAYGKSIREHYLRQTQARYQHAAATEYPFYERLVYFWSNHFAVSADKRPIPAIAGAFENEAIRPYLSGSFVELLIAAEQHPAMLLYLDNQRSVGPNSTAGKRAAKRRSNRQVGLNENLPREILELHTLGVNAGYSQQDVTSFAKVITGWSVGGGERKRDQKTAPGTFVFRQNIHEPGTQQVFGNRYEDTGVKQGEAVLRDLAAHPATARHLATKLATHFVSDKPPQTLIDDLTKVFIETDGSLPDLHAALVDAPEAWAHDAQKYKSPQDFLISAFRAFDRMPDGRRTAFNALRLMGQPAYSPGSPAGWPDTTDHWGGADALYKRIEWSNTVARMAGNGVNPVAMGEAMLGPRLTLRTRTAISRAESVVQGITLLLASPDFQRR